MCGIAGLTRNLCKIGPEKVLSDMNNAMHHRGPDDGDIYFDEGVGLCHRRLSIIDLSEDGKQPMSSSDGRYTIVFNGEIYNFISLKKDLLDKGYKFNSKTDTEVLLNLYIEYGESSLEKINGMFAYAIWDKHNKKLFAARDRLGKKPFFYYHSGEHFAFASELKSITRIKDLNLTVDSRAVVDYLKYLFIPHPGTIYNNVYKLEPGYYLTFQEGRTEVKKYWDIEPCAGNCSNEEEIVEGLLDVIENAVKSRLISDVPLGAFLSGGIDSSGVVKLMSMVLDKPVTTCSIGFDDKRHNEALYAKEFAEMLSADHHEYYVQDKPEEIIKKLVWHFDEPFADSSMVPTYYVSNLARKNVTVALSGDGGDESFAGYAKYTADMRENRLRELIPGFLVNILYSITENSISGLPKRLNSLTGSLKLSPDEAFYVTNTFITDKQIDALLTPDIRRDTAGYDPAHYIKRYYNRFDTKDHLSKILYTDLKLYLPGDVLVKVDRMSMANSLEVRCPLLDYKVIEYASGIPSYLKMHGSEKKYILKKAFEKILPEKIRNRPKHGFDVPLDNWFRSDLKNMAEETLLHNDAIKDFFNPQSVNDIWKEHIAGRADHGTLLWTLFTFSLWSEICL